MTDQQIDELLEMLAKSPTSARDMVRGLFAANEAKAAPAEPFGYFRAEPFGWTDCAADDEGAIALYERPAAPAVPMSESQRADMICAVAAICTGTSSRTVAATAIEWVERYYGITTPASPSQEPAAWVPHLVDRADGVKGHYAIGRWNPRGFREVWNLHTHRWAAYSDDVMSLEEADSLLRQITIPTIAAAPSQEPALHIGACITDGVLHATVMRRESNGHVTILATAEMDSKSLLERDCLAKLSPTPAQPAVPDDVMSILRAIHRRPSDAGIWLDDLTRILRNAATDARKPLTEIEMEKGREQLFSTNNPYCPCDRKTFKKVAEWVERHHGIAALREKGAK